MEQNKFEPQCGMKAIHGFREVEVRTMEDGRVTSLQEGGFIVSGYDLKCYKCTPENIQFANEVEKRYRQLHALNGNLNFPRIVDFLETRCEGFYEIRYSFFEVLSAIDLLLVECTTIVGQMSAFGFHLIRQK